MFILIGQDCNVGVRRDAFTVQFNERFISTTDKVTTTNDVSPLPTLNLD